MGTKRLTLAGSIALMSLIGPAAPAPALQESGAVCLVTFTATFSPALTTTPTNGSMGLNSTSSLCVGTAITEPVGIGGGMSGLRSCEGMLVSGTASFNYPNSSTGAIIVYSGTVAGGTLALAPNGGILAGSAVLAGVPSVPTNCANATGVSSVTFAAVLAFADPVL